MTSIEAFIQYIDVSGNFRVVVWDMFWNDVIHDNTFNTSAKAIGWCVSHNMTYPIDINKTTFEVFLNDECILVCDSIDENGYLVWDESF